MMRLLALALALVSATAPAGAQTQSPSPAPAGPPRLSFPIDWDAMPPLPYRTQPPISEQMSRWVAGEIARRKCPPPPQVRGRYVVRVDVAVLLSGADTVRAAIPRAIDCPTVEQYTAGMVSSFARQNLLSRPGDGSGWYRASVVFDWPA